MANFRDWFSRVGITEHRLFLAGIILKAIDGFLECLTGIMLLILGAGYVKHLLWLWTSDVLSEDSDNTVAHHVAHIAQHLSTHQTLFAALYLILHGVLKLGLVAGMIERIHWAYPLAAAALAAFIGYQIYRIAGHFSFILIFLTIVDGLIVVLILLEYARLRRSSPDS